MGKVRELVDLLKDLPWDVKSLRDFPPVPAPAEDADTFAENAVAKARYYSDAFGVAAVADDSGLVVDALEGAPGVTSARYSGDDADDARNNAKLLAALADVPEEGRTARFVCCAAYVDPDGEAFVEAGKVEGRVAFAPAGDGGFGYDPLFIPDGYDITFGEFKAEAKHRISHRGNAFRKLRDHLRRLA